MNAGDVLTFRERDKRGKAKTWSTSLCTINRHLENHNWVRIVLHQRRARAIDLGQRPVASGLTFGQQSHETDYGPVVDLCVCVSSSINSCFSAFVAVRFHLRCSFSLSSLCLYLLFSPLAWTWQFSVDGDYAGSGGVDSHPIRPESCCHSVCVWKDNDAIKKGYFINNDGDDILIW